MQVIQLSRFGRFLVTREDGRAVAADLPIDADVLCVSFSEIEAASPSFLDELARSLIDRGVRSVIVTDATEHIARNLERVSELSDHPGFPRARVEFSSV